MSHRDDLDAALARIAALERELGEGAGAFDRLAALQAERDALLAEAERRRDEAERARAEQQDAVAQLERTRRALVDPAPDRPSLAEHNRGFPPLELSIPAGVFCPICLLGGERVEMMRRPPFRSAMVGRDNAFIGNQDIQREDCTLTQALCPRCCYLGLMRTA